MSDNPHHAYLPSTSFMAPRLQMPSLLDSGLVFHTQICIFVKWVIKFSSQKYKKNIASCISAVTLFHGSSALDVFHTQMRTLRLLEIDQQSYLWELLFCSQFSKKVCHFRQSAIHPEQLFTKASQLSELETEPIFEQVKA